MQRWTANTCVAATLLGAMLIGGCGDRVEVSTDPSEPLGAIGALTVAIQQYDAEKAASFYVQESDEQKRYVQALTGLLAASKALRDEAVARYGSEDAHQLTGLPPGADAARQFAEGTVTVEGDIATAKASTGHVMRLKRVGAQWKILPPDDPAIVSQVVEGATKGQEKLEKLTQEIKDGKYPDAQQAKQALLANQQ